MFQAPPTVVAMSLLLVCILPISLFLVGFFFFNDTATTEIYTLSLHDALPISPCGSRNNACGRRRGAGRRLRARRWQECRDRKSTRLNSSHQIISYAVFCLKKKKKQRKDTADHKRQR